MIAVVFAAMVAFAHWLIWAFNAVLTGAVVGFMGAALWRIPVHA